MGEKSRRIDSTSPESTIKRSFVIGYLRKKPGFFHERNPVSGLSPGSWSSPLIIRNLVMTKIALTNYCFCELIHSRI
jgi:hypothetical protein